MRPFFLLLLIQACMLHLSAQNNIDSFETAARGQKEYALQIKSYIDFTDKLRLLNFDNAIRIGNEGLMLAKKNDDALSEGKLERRMGEAAYFKGTYDDAAKLLYRSIAALEKSGDKPVLAESYNALARLYRKTRDLTQAAQNYDRAMKLYSAANDSAGIATILNESGVVFEYSGKYDSAAGRYSASLHIDERRKDTIGICYALSNLAGVYILQNKFAPAEDYLLTSLRLRKKMRDSFALALNYSDLGSAFFSAGDPAKAMAYTDTSNRIAEMLKFPELQKTNYELLARLMEKQGDFKSALDFYKKRAVINDSLFSIEKTKQIEELNTRYETEEKEAKIREQQNRISRQNIIMLAAIIALVLITLLVYTQYRRNRLRREALAQAQLMRQQEHAAHAVMKAEEAERRRIAIDLHDGVGQIMSAAKMNLSAYEDRVVFHSPEERASFEKIISLVDTGCREVRAVSHNMMPNALLNNSLPAAVREFIEKLDDSSLTAHLSGEGFDNTPATTTDTVLYRIIQECVNNVIKHAKATTIDISMVKDADGISVTVEDNGQGFDTSAVATREGIGLKNIRTRIEYLKGTVDFTGEPGKERSLHCISRVSSVLGIIPASALVLLYKRKNPPKEGSLTGNVLRVIT